jgi:hypothetical protein
VAEEKRPAQAPTLIVHGLILAQLRQQLT